MCGCAGDFAGQAGQICEEVKYLLLAIFLCVFCLGGFAGQVMEQERIRPVIARLESSVEWYSKELEGTRSYYWYLIQDLEYQYSASVTPNE